MPKFSKWSLSCGILYQHLVHTSVTPTLGTHFCYAGIIFPDYLILTYRLSICFTVKRQSVHPTAFISEDGWWKKNGKNKKKNPWTDIPRKRTLPFFRFVIPVAFSNTGLL